MNEASRTTAPASPVFTLDALRRMMEVLDAAPKQPTYRYVYTPEIRVRRVVDARRQVSGSMRKRRRRMARELSVLVAYAVRLERNTGTY